MTRSVFLYVLFIALLITGCSATTPEPLKSTPELPESNLPSLDGNWRIKMTHSGGIMGLSRSIEISSDGEYVVTDDHTGETINGELPADELTKLADHVATNKLPSGVYPEGFGCADCFVYNLEIQVNEKIVNIQLNDISLPSSGLEPLVTYLRGLIEAALK